MHVQSSVLLNCRSGQRYPFVNCEGGYSCARSWSSAITGRSVESAKRTRRIGDGRNPENFILTLRMRGGGKDSVVIARSLYSSLYIGIWNF